MNEKIERDRTGLVDFIKEENCLTALVGAVALHEGSGMSQSLLGIGVCHVMQHLEAIGYEDDMLSTYLDGLPDGAFDSDVNGNVEAFIEDPKSYFNAAMLAGDELRGTPLITIYSLGLWEVLNEAKNRGCTEKVMELV